MEAVVVGSASLILSPGERGSRTESIFHAARGRTDSRLFWSTRFNNLVSSFLDMLLVRSSSWTLPLLVLSGYSCNELDVKERPQDLMHQIDQAEFCRERKLAGYTVTEYYRIENSHFSKPAEATIETTYRRRRGKTYKVLSRTGPSLLRNRVLDRLLQEERDMSRGKMREQAIITSANYDMKLIGKEPVGGTICDVLELIPKRKSPYLLKGRLWLDPANIVIVKIEGKPPTSASFFSGRPEIVRDYKEVNGFALAQHSRAVSSSFLFGRSTVDIEYRNYHVITSAR
jgi:hypothetical protein